MVMIFGEITTKENVDYEKIVRDTCRAIGFVSDDVGLDADNCNVLVNIEQQSPDIAQGVHGHFTKRPEEICADDQGHMFSYATDETPELMPLSHVLATKLGACLTEVRKNGTCPWLRPDGKTQVTVEYRNDGGAMVPIRVHTVLISTQHDETMAEVDTFLFTSESVNEGYPDKLCDQISDAILDACLEQDPDSKVACETCSKTNMVMIFGEITTKENVDYEKIVRDTCRAIGFVSDDVGLDADNCKVLVNIEQQSPDIAQGVHGHFTKRPEEICADDQGHMFSYATDETPELMPLSHVLATKLGARLTEVRKNSTCPWLRPDGKTQVTVEYRNDGGAMVPIRVHTVLISTQHDETVTPLHEKLLGPAMFFFY
ncbi:hypothetical protein M5K25_003579 [Dendrobium thyrsiflorum]|uniref:methionine adenosyltransferase n=1 Tax=Dendrobium thyrsiflorum TaxID=117978 RepID=A0ABD0VJL0_DENTH